MFNPYSPSFSGCTCKVKKALKLTVTPAVPFKALCPRKNPAKSSPTYKKMKAKKNFLISPQLIDPSMGLGPQ